MTLAYEIRWLQELDVLPAAEAARCALASSSPFETDRLADIVPALIDAIQTGQQLLPTWLAIGIADHFLVAQIAPRLIRALRRMEGEAFLSEICTAVETSPAVMPTAA